MNAVLRSESIRKVYGQGANVQPVLHDVCLELMPGTCAALVGPSGSGKTTLLSILGCLLSPSEGRLAVNGRSVYPKPELPLTEFRRRHIGFVFQHAQLLPFLSVDQNLRIVGRNCGLSERTISERIDRLLDRLAISDQRHKLPGHLSGGQRQRVSITRALIHQPAVVLADEPTAALDWENGQAAVKLLVDEAQAANCALLVVTHDTRLLSSFNQVYQIRDGRLEDAA